MECPICYNILTNSCVGSCMHHYCLPCLVKWCERGGTSCPICKTFIREIRPDLEFNRINCPGTPDLCLVNVGQKVVIDFSNSDRMRLTIANNCSLGGLGKRGPGVKITKITKKDKSYKSGLCIGDIILFINNVPCIDHKQTVGIIDNCIATGVPLTFSLFKKPTARI